MAEPESAVGKLRRVRLADGTDALVLPAGALTDEEVARLRAQWDALYRGPAEVITITVPGVTGQTADPSVEAGLIESVPTTMHR